MAELMAKLIRQLAPIEHADINDDPGGVWIFVVKLDVRLPPVAPLAQRKRATQYTRRGMFPF